MASEWNKDSAKRSSPACFSAAKELDKQYSRNIIMESPHIPAHEDWAGSPTATSSHCSAPHCAQSQDLSWQFYASDRKLSTHVDVSLLDETCVGNFSSSHQTLRQECSQVRAQARLLRTDNHLLKAQLKAQRQDLRTLQVEYQSTVAALHRDICQLRGQLRHRRRG